MSEKLNKAFEAFAEKYVAKRTKEMQLDTIKSYLKESYAKNKLTSSEELEKNNLVIRETVKKKYVPKNEEELYDFLEGTGLLPLAVKISPSIEKHFNLDKAKTNHKQSVRLYTGKNSPVDKKSLTGRFTRAYEHLDVSELSDSFNGEYGVKKLSESELDVAKEHLLEVMLAEKIHSLKTEIGVIKVTETYDYDPYILFDFLSGRKEIYLKKDGNSYDVLILPDNKKARLPGNFKINDKEIQEYEKEKKIEASNFIKKSEYNKLKKESFNGYKFEIPVDPYDFFRKLEISRTKLLDLANEVGDDLLSEKDIENFYEVIEDENNTSIQILTSGVAEKQRDMFFDRMLKKAEKMRNKAAEQAPVVPSFDNSLVQVGFDDFSF